MILLKFSFDIKVKIISKIANANISESGVSKTVAFEIHDEVKISDRHKLLYVTTENSMTTLFKQIWTTLCT